MAVASLKLRDWGPAKHTENLAGTALSLGLPCSRAGCEEGMCKSDSTADDSLGVCPSTPWQMPGSLLLRLTPGALGGA